MLRPAILCTEQMILTGLDRFEPLAGVSAGYDILFHTKGWNEKTVDHVLRCHQQLDRAADRDVQFIDLARALRVLDLPHPLLADGTMVRADDQYLRDSILQPAKQITAGYENIMPSFAGHLSEEEIMQLIAYLKAIGQQERPAR